MLLVPVQLHITAQGFARDVQQVEVGAVGQFFFLEGSAPVILVIFTAVHFLSPAVKHLERMLWIALQAVDAQVIVDSVAIGREAGINREFLTIYPNKYHRRLAVIPLADAVLENIRRAGIAILSCGLIQNAVVDLYPRSAILRRRGDIEAADRSCNIIREYFYYHRLACEGTQGIIVQL